MRHIFRSSAGEHSVLQVSTMRRSDFLTFAHAIPILPPTPSKHFVSGPHNQLLPPILLLLARQASLQSRQRLCFFEPPLGNALDKQIQKSDRFSQQLHFVKNNPTTNKEREGCTSATCKLLGAMKGDAWSVLPPDEQIPG